MAMELQINSQSSVHIGGIWGTIRPGQNYRATDGLRQVVHADSSLIFYVQNNALWGQQTQSFIDEIRTYPVIQGAQNSVGMVRLAEFEVNVLLGIVAASSSVGLLTVVGVDVFKFLVTHRDHFAVWQRQMQAFLKARSRLKVKAPTLYEKIFEAFLQQFWGATCAGMPTAMLQPDAAGKLTGVMLGKLGRAAVQTRLTALGTVWIILSSVAGKLLTSVPTAIRLTVEEYKQSAQDLIKQLQLLKISISEREAQQIFQEIARNPHEIYTVFQELRMAFAHR
jgi:hypothetical protein